MEQTSLPFHYEEENESTGMTALSGLPAYLDLAAVARLGESVRRHVGVREGTQGWTDAQMVMSLVMLNLSGGESVDDPRSSRGQALRLLERDEGLGRVLLAGESHRMQRADRRAQRNRWRRERRRVVPSPTAVFRYLDNFHDEAEEAMRQPGKAFIPAAKDALRGLGKVNSDLVGFAGGHSGHTKGDFGHGRYADRDAQAPGQLLLQEVQGIPAADGVLARGGPCGALRVQRRQRERGL